MKRLPELLAMQSNRERLKAEWGEFKLQEKEAAQRTKDAYSKLIKAGSDYKDAVMEAFGISQHSDFQ